MNNIWMYWENSGREMPEFVRLSIETVRKRKGSARLNLLDQRSILDYIPSLRPEWHRLRKAAHKADYIRTRLVHRHGGLWLDTDMVALRALEPLFDIPGHYDFACQNIGSCIGCFAARPGCQLLAQVMEAQDHVLDSNPHDFPWNGIGNDLMTKFGSDYECHLWQEWTVDEIAGAKVTKLLSRTESVNNNVDRNAIVFHLCGNLLSPLLDTYARYQHRNLIESRMLVSKILRQGLELSEPARRGHLPSIPEMMDFFASFEFRVGAVGMTDLKLGSRAGAARRSAPLTPASSRNAHPRLNAAGCGSQPWIRKRNVEQPTV